MYIQGFHADGTPSEHAIRGSTLINIYSSAGLVELAAPCGTHPRGAAILERATDDPKVKEALNLVGDQELNWSQIYDVIEFLGGAKE
jgi:hypothetical protein